MPAGVSLVALLAEGVDRNRSSAERERLGAVALLAEGVDRNSLVMSMTAFGLSRPPRGGRG